MPGSSAGAASKRDQLTELSSPASPAPATADETRYVEPHRNPSAPTRGDNYPLPAAAAETGCVEHHSLPDPSNGGHIGEAAAALELRCSEVYSPFGKSTLSDRVEAVAAAGMRQAADADHAEARPAAARAAKMPPSYDSSDDEEVPAAGRPSPFRSSLQARNETSGFALATGQVTLSFAVGADSRPLVLTSGGSTARDLYPTRPAPVYTSAELSQDFDALKHTYSGLWRLLGGHGTLL